MDNLLDDLAIEIFRRVSASGFTNLAPMLTVSKKQSQLAFSPGVLRLLPLDEFFNNAELINEGSSFRCFFKKCVAAKNPVAIYLESLRIAAQTGDISVAIDMLFSVDVVSDYNIFARGIFLITADFTEPGIATISYLFSRVGSVAQMDVIGNVVYRHLLIFRPVTRRLFANLRVVDSIPRCLGGHCTVQSRCLNCFLFWFVVKFNNVLRR
ncbi:hypothetical protein ARALYDRAFT_902577 [Arabidopsis lyrata subsp. lyrata]|uniref:Uncharacterized protein n=1 Tax=Arabidopsis lyrata subsp. lyrata TaxID=81972 RepID=D7LHP5_ARALL|nr:hypothetical protein ARALYDRAFT_902577 [Arabidopsis lyrata subsp. lyrata]